MVASYPKAVKGFVPRRNFLDVVMAADVNDLQDEIATLESVLGVDPLSMVDKDPNQTTPWTDVAGRLDALDVHWTTPVFSTWSDGSWIDGVSPAATSTASTTWGPYQTYGIADSPDNFPGGQYGQHPSYAPALEQSGGSYGFEWTSQADYVAYTQAAAIRAGGEADSTHYRYPVTSITTATSAFVDTQGFFTLQAPPAGYDPLGWYNGSNGFLIKKTGWYHLTGSIKWASVGGVTAGLEGTHQLILFAGNKPVAMEDAVGSIGSEGLYVTTSYTGIIRAGTNIGIGVAVFNTASFRAEQPRLSGVFLRGV